jgi:hypothetical protein
MEPESKSAASRSCRFPAGLPAVLLDGGNEYPCVAADLSRTGVLLEGEPPATIGPDIEFVIRSQVGELQQRFVGRVVRSGPVGKGEESRIAARFLRLDEEQTRVLEMLIARVKEGLAPTVFDELPPDAPPHAVREALATVPLPHRIAMAARAGPRQREFLRRDSHPQVLDSLARNPNLLRNEARALAALTLLTPGTMETLATDPRWSHDEAILITLATHPNVPMPLAERIVARLQEPALRRLLKHPSLNTALRDRIAKRVGPRRGV